MSRRLLLLSALSLGAVGTAQGQTLEQLERRVAILEARDALLKDSLKLVAAQAFERQPRITVAGDGFAIAAPAWAAPRLARGAAEAAPGWRERYGKSFESLRGDTLVIWIDERDARFRTDLRNIEWRFAGVSGSSAIVVDARNGYDPLAVAPALAIRDWEQSLLDPATASWLGSQLTGARGDGLTRGALGALLASDAGPARRCLSGRIADCERLLDLDSPADSVTRWYDAGDRVWARELQNVRNDVPGRAACLSGNASAACYALLRSQRIRVPRPVDNSVRESFYRFVVEAGGDGAIERFHSSAGRTAGEKLSAVAGRPVSGLVPAWRASLDRDRPDRRGGLALSVMSAIGWMVVFALLFAWRFRWIRV